jgi:hypothetical protein
MVGIDPTRELCPPDPKLVTPFARFPAESTAAERSAGPRFGGKTQPPTERIRHISGKKSTRPDAGSEFQ